jgi:hypothetical protein
MASGALAPALPCFCAEPWRLPGDRVEGAFDDLYGRAAEVAGKRSFDQLLAVGVRVTH